MNRTAPRIALLAAALLVAPTLAAAQATGYPADTTAKPDTMPKKEPPPPPTPAAKPLGGLDFSAWVFGNYQLQTDSAAKAANGGSKPNKFDIGRAYLTFRGPLGDRTSFRVTTDIKAGTSADTYKGWFVRLKYGYLQYDYAKPSPQGTAAFARIGMLHTVVIDHEENFWPRYLAQTAVEKNGFFSSADLGAATQITLPNKWGEVYGDVVNGTGYENPENNKYKDFQLRVSLTPLGQTNGLLKTLAISPWVSSGGNASTFLNDPTNPNTNKLTKNRYGVFVGNRDRRLTFGAEWAQRKDDSDGATAAAPTTTVTGQLLDGFVILRPFEFQNPDAKSSFGVVGRFDKWKPNKDVAAWQQFIVAGIFWEPTRKSALALDYQMQEPKSGLSGTKSETWFLHWNLVF